MALKSLLSVRKVFLFLFVLAALASKAQSPTYGCYITNEVIVSPTVYQFDLYLLNTSTTTFEYAVGQWGITVNSAVAAGGTLTPSIVAGSSQLTNSSQIPTNVTLPSTFVFNILAKSPPGAGSGSVISNVNTGCSSPGTRVATFRITNTVAFPINGTMNHVFNFTNAAGKTQTKVFGYVATVDSDITNVGTFYNYNSANTCLQNITAAPTFSCYLTNEIQVSSNVYQFDLYMLRTGGNPFQYAQGQFGISVNSAVANGGTLSASVVAGSTGLSVASQEPNSVQLPSSTFMFNIAARTPPGPGAGAFISNVKTGCTSPGTRLATFRITNTAQFAAGSHMNHVFNFTTAANQTQTQVFAYMGTGASGVNTEITTNGTYYSYNVASTCLQNIALVSCSVTATATSTPTSCFGGSNGTATVTTNGSSPTFLWSTGATTQTITGRPAGTYSVTVTDNVGCTGTTTVAVTQPPVVVATCSATAVTCTSLGNDGTATVVASGGTSPYTYLWSNGKTTSVNTALTAGSYSVTVTDSHGCTGTCTSTVAACNHLTMILDSCRQTDPTTIQFDLLIVSDGSPTSDVRLNSTQWGVNFNTAILKAGDTFFDTTHGSPFYFPGSSDFIPPLNTFNYQNNSSEIRIVESVYSGGNTGSTMIVGHRYRVGRFKVTSSQILIGNSSPNFVLQPDTGAIGGKTPTIAVAWVGTNSTPSNFLSPGTTSGKASLSTACSLVLNPCDLTVTNAVTSPSCLGSSNGSITANPSSVNDFEPWTYAWSTGSTDQVISNLAAGTYTVTVTDDATCTVAATVVVTQPTAITATASNNGPVCTGSNLNLSSNPTGGTSPYTYSWSGPNGFTSAAQNPSIASVTAAAAGTYTVVVIDSRGCTNSTTTAVTVNVCNSTVTVKFYVQGYYVTGGTMKPVMQLEGVAGATGTQVDTFTIELHNPTTPYALAENFKGVAATSGNMVCTFSGSTVGNSYYIVIKHRNAMETWSASPVAISSSTNYDFTTAAALAFGSNMKFMEAGRFAIYSGDINQDGICNGIDFNLLDADARAIATGYKKTDLNGDNIVNGLDFNLLEANVRAIISKQRP